MSDNGYREVDGDWEMAQQIAPYVKFEVDTDTGIVEIKFRGPASLKEELQNRAQEEGITMTELLKRAAEVYIASKPLKRKSGRYYELHEPGEPPKRIPII